VFDIPGHDQRACAIFIDSNTGRASSASLAFATPERRRDPARFSRLRAVAHQARARPAAVRTRTLQAAR